MGLRGEPGTSSSRLLPSFGRSVSACTTPPATHARARETFHPCHGERPRHGRRPAASLGPARVAFSAPAFDVQVQLATAGLFDGVLTVRRAEVVEEAAEVIGFTQNDTGLG